MGTKFNITGSVLNNQSKEQERKDLYRVVNVPYEKIQPNDKNFYDTSDIAELAEAIEEDGLKHPLEVYYQRAEDRYILLGGERRYRAIGSIRSKDQTRFAMVPCIVTVVKDELDERRRIIISNSTARVLTDAEMMRQIRELQEIYRQQEAAGIPIKGKKREIIAKDLGISPAQVQRLDVIDKKLTPPIKEEFEKGNVPLTVAVEAAKLEPKEQKKLTNKLRQTSEITKEDVRKVKEASAQKPEEKPAEGGTAFIGTDVLKVIDEYIGSLKESLKSGKNIKMKDYIKVVALVEDTEDNLEKLERMISRN